MLVDCRKDPTLRLPGMPTYAELTAENAKLRAALAPFAQAYRPDSHRDADPAMQTFLDANCITPSMTRGAFRFAYETLTPPAERRVRD